MDAATPIIHIVMMAISNDAIQLYLWGGERGGGQRLNGGEEEDGDGGVRRGKKDCDYDVN